MEHPTVPWVYPPISFANAPKGGQKGLGAGTVRGIGIILELGCKICACLYVRTAARTDAHTVSFYLSRVSDFELFDLRLTMKVRQQQLECCVTSLLIKNIYIMHNFD